MKKIGAKYYMIELNKMIWIRQNLKEIIKDDLKKNLEKNKRFIEVDQIKKNEFNPEIIKSYGCSKWGRHNKVVIH